MNYIHDGGNVSLCLFDVSALRGRSNFYIGQYHKILKNDRKKWKISEILETNYQNCKVLISYDALAIGEHWIAPEIVGKRRKVSESI